MAGEQQMVTYTGAGWFLPGVPQRDIPLDEWESLAAELREQALALRLYRLPESVLVDGQDKSQPGKEKGK